MREITVLLVDDEVDFTASTKKVLSRRGFVVKVAEDGLTALPLIAKEHFNVVVLDMKMPGMDGLHVLSEIKRFSPDISVIILTGHYSLSEEEEALKAGAYAYLLKPYPILDLANVIVKALSDADTGSNSSARVQDPAK
ncbi:MAG TPA: response regulator [Desulfomonilaceae bacterium]|nr:response regulator [Desulfomonilaceae bacterium]